MELDSESAAGGIDGRADEGDVGDRNIGGPDGSQPLLLVDKGEHGVEGVGGSEQHEEQSAQL